MTGRSPSGRAGRPTAQAPAGLGDTATIPNALVDGLGSIVSMIADARDTYPDGETTLQAVTEAVNELYGCAIDGVFGPIQFPLADEAYGEALRRYPDAAGALCFLWGASGLGLREPNAEQLAWAREKAQAIEARRAETATEIGGSVHESAVAASDAPNTPSQPSNGDEE
jgi:hypothetical protein